MVFWDSCILGSVGYRAKWLESSPFSGCHKISSARYVDKQLPRRCWQLGFIVPATQREKAGKCSPAVRFPGGTQWVLKCRLIRSWTLRQQLRDFAVKRLWGKNRRWVFSKVPSALSPEGEPWESDCLFAIVLWYLWMQIPLALRARWFGVHRSGGGLQSWGTICMVHMVPLREKLGVGSIPVVSLCARAGVCGESVFQPFLPTHVGISSVT